MSRSMPTREAKAMLAMACLGLGAISAPCQVPIAAGQGTSNSTLPTQQPTASIPATPSPNEPARVRSTKLEIVSANGSLTVHAENASLNRILHEISQKTGIKVSGSVGEESVFGSYGPASTAVVLSELLEGTASNVLLVDKRTGPQELILSPRGGKATAPRQSPAGAQNNVSDGQNQEQYVPPVQPFRAPVATGRGPVGANSDGSPLFSQPADDNDGATVNAGAPQRTPQQIYEQLQSLSNQQQQQQQTPPE